MAPDIDYAIEYTPIDDAALVCAKLITSTIETNEIYHIFNPYPVSMKELMATFAEGIDFEFVDPLAFQQYFFQEMQKEEVDEEILRFSLHMGLFKDEQVKTAFTKHAEKTNAILQKLDFKWQEVTKDILAKVIKNR